MRVGFLPGGGVTVSSAVQTDVAGEINALSAVTVATGDLLMFEDISNGNAKGKGAVSGILALISGPKWVSITASGSQASIDETATPDLITAFDTLGTGSTGHGVTVSGGIVTLPANTTGFQWQIEARLAVTHSSNASGSIADFQFYSLPASTNTAIGLYGEHVSVANSVVVSVGGFSDPIAWFAGTGTVGLRCTFTSSSNTVSIAAGSYLLVREVAA